MGCEPVLQSSVFTGREKLAATAATTTAEEEAAAESKAYEISVAVQCRACGSNDALQAISSGEGTSPRLVHCNAPISPHRLVYFVVLLHSAYSICPP